MRIQLKKSKDKNAVLACHRDDGSTTWTELGPGGAYHELAHYVVETTLGYRQGFYGMIEGGADITEFNHSNQDRGWGIPEEGYFAEWMASLVQAAVGSGHFDPAYAQMLADGANNMDLPFPEIPEAELMEQMRLQAAAYVHEWETLEPGEEMELVFRQDTD